MEFTLKRDNMNLKNFRKPMFLSLWWFLEACALYYCLASLGVGIIIVAIILIFASCLLPLLQSYRIKAIIYLLLSVYSICFLLGIYTSYLFSMRIEQYTWHYISFFAIAVINIWISFRGFWYNWKKCLPLK